MKIKCEYCGNYIDDSDETCSSCGGVNSHLVRNAIGVPKTIEELKQWCMQKNIPLEQARFFIGQDYKGARAFGIYKDENTGNYIVYKNKSDGNRAIRYEGKDEEYAVNEIYLKLKDEMLNQKQHIKARNNTSQQNNKRRNTQKGILGFFSKYYISIIIAFIIIVIVWAVVGSGPDRGYYQYNNQVYYYQPSDGWYEYNNDSWYHTSVDSDLVDHADDYFDSSYYDDDYGTSDFTDSGYYNDDSSDDSYDNDWDSGWDSSDSWDSGDTDWGSDW